MNMKKSTMMRNADLVLCARQVLSLSVSRKQVLNLSQLIEATLSRRPKMHYIDYDRASRVLHAIDVRGLDAVVKGKMARMYWTELRDQVAEAMSSRRNLNFARALTFVLSFRRPSRFYITPNAAFKILSAHFRAGLVEVRL